MSRRRKRSATRNTTRKSSPKGRRSPSEDPPAEDNRLPAPAVRPPKPRKWLLALALLLQAGWLGFLLAMACQGRPG